MTSPLLYKIQCGAWHVVQFYPHSSADTVIKLKLASFNGDTLLKTAKIWGPGFVFWFFHNKVGKRQTPLFCFLRDFILMVKRGSRLDFRLSMILFSRIPIGYLSPTRSCKLIATRAMITDERLYIRLLTV